MWASSLAWALRFFVLLVWSSPETHFFSDPSVLEALPVREAGLAFFFLPGFVLASVSRVAFLLVLLVRLRVQSGERFHEARVVPSVPFISRPCDDQGLKPSQ